AEIAFDTAFLLDGLPEAVDFVFGQVANLLGVIDVGLFGELFGALLPDPVDRRQAHPKPLLNLKINARNTCPALLLESLLPLPFHSQGHEGRGLRFQISSPRHSKAALL